MLHNFMYALTLCAGQDFFNDDDDDEQQDEQQEEGESSEEDDDEEEEEEEDDERATESVGKSETSHKTFITEVGLGEVKARSPPAKPQEKIESPQKSEGQEEDGEVCFLMILFTQIRIMIVFYYFSVLHKLQMSYFQTYSISCVTHL